MKRQFDKFAEDYREIHTENVLKVSGADSDYFTEYKIAEISKFINNGKVWLDFGCGDGNSARFILKYFPQSQYYGVDVSSESIEVAKKRNISSAHFECYDGNRLPFCFIRQSKRSSLKTTHNIPSNLNQFLFKVLLHNSVKNGREKYMIIKETL